MDIQLIVELLDGNISPLDFQSKIESEVDRHTVHLKKKGASCPIYLTGSDRRQIYLGPVRVQRLKSAARTFKPETKVYLLDAITLSDRFTFLEEVDREWCENEANSEES